MCAAQAQTPTDLDHTLRIANRPTLAHALQHEKGAEVHMAMRHAHRADIHVDARRTVKEQCSVCVFAELSGHGLV